MASAPAPSAVNHVLVGGYTPEMGGSASGISCWRAETGERHTSIALASPSFLIGHPRRPWVFAVTESSPGQVTSLALRPDGTLRRLSSSTTTGEEGCHLALTPDAGHLVVAHYGSGSLSSYAVGQDGTLSEQLSEWQLAGRGPDPERQQGPHAHQVVSYRDELLVCDLGTDRIHRLALGGDGRFSWAAEPIQLPGGAGPRHLVIIGDHLVVACELSAELWLGRRKDTGWQGVGRVPTSSGRSGVRSAPSAIVADGNRVFVANRGPGTVAVFDLDPEQDLLRPAAEFAVGGSWPRDLALGAGRIWVANQADHTVTAFSTAGLPHPQLDLEFAAPSPTCLLLLDRLGVPPGDLLDDPEPALT